MPDQPFDYFRLDDRLTAGQRDLRLQVRHFVETRVRPEINPFWERAEFPRDLALGLRTLPILGTMLQGHGCAGLDALSAGLVRYELGRGDGSIGTFYGVHSGLAMGSIGMLGSKEQQARWLPAMARLEKIGAFGLTEPERGSDAAHLLTRARRDGDAYVLDGHKRWIGNAAIADLLIIWAQEDTGGLGGFVIENPGATPGVTMRNMGGKISKRAVLNADITLEAVRVPAGNRLAKAHSFRDLSRVLFYTRYAICWEAAGIGAACLELALRYAGRREQFGRPIAGFQLVQQKLVEMAAAVVEMQLTCFRLAELVDQDQATGPMISLAKYATCKKARDVARLAREVLGGNGILIENHVARLLLDAEAIFTYEGTNEINLLIVGRDLTGVGAFT